MREELGDRYIYIVLITALGDSEQVLEGMSAGADDYLIKPVDPFAVQTRLVAAERVTALHRQVVDFRAQLEQANLDATRTLAHRPADRARQSPPHGGGPRRAPRPGRSGSIGATAWRLFDIDHFKLYNDHYGHLAGDELLRQVAQCFDKAVRAGESVYRYGGEEFLLLLPECSVEGALVAAERLRQAVADSRTASRLPADGARRGDPQWRGVLLGTRPPLVGHRSAASGRSGSLCGQVGRAQPCRGGPTPVLALNKVDGRFDDVREA